MKNEKLKTLGWILFGCLTSVIGCVLLHVIGAFASEDRKEYWQKGAKKAWLGCFCWMLFTFVKCSYNTGKNIEEFNSKYNNSRYY